MAARETGRPVPVPSAVQHGEHVFDVWARAGGAGSDECSRGPLQIMMTKQQAVAAQIDQAMRSHEQQDHASAITLATAAEGAMPPSEAQTLFELIRGLGAERLDEFPRGERDVADWLNREAHWLKHYNNGQPDEMEIPDSLMVILRAVHKYHAVYGRDAETATMREFFGIAREFLEEN
jgi:hypothetical protein